MTNIRVVIADDEPLARQGIRQLLRRQQDFEVIAETGDGRNTLTVTRDLKPDLLFLDVQMPFLSGFDVLHGIDPKNLPAVIFVTAYDEFAVRAFEAQAVDYLVKPLEAVRFAQAVERVRKWLLSAKSEELAHQLADVMSEQKRGTERIFVRTSSRDVLVLDANEIIWIEADDYYAAIHARGHRHLLRESLDSLEQRLDATRFVRAHRSAIVNIDRVRKLRRQAGETFVVLTDGVDVPVSRRRREHVLRLLRS